MPYTAPSGNAIAFDFTIQPYTAPVGSAIAIELAGAITGAIAESFTITDSTSVSAVVTVYDVSISESFAISDTTSETYTLVYAADSAESFAVTDSTSATLLFNVAEDESFALSDTTDMTVDRNRSITESFAITDVLGLDRTTDAAVTELFNLQDVQDFNPFPVDVPGIHFDWRPNHLGYVPPAGNTIPFNIPENGQYFYSQDNLIDHHLPSQLPNLPYTAASPGDPYWGNVVLNVAFTGPNESSGYVDTSQSGHILTSSTIAFITTQSRFGTGYGAADVAHASSSSNINIPDSDDWWFGADPFTLDVSVRWDVDQSSIQAFFAQWGGSTQLGWWFGYIYGQLAFYWSTNGTNNPNLSVSFTPVIGDWYDISVTRSAAGVLRIYVNDVVVATGTNTDTLFNSNRTLMLGNDNNGGVFDHVTFKGYIGAARITQGIDRYDGTKPLLAEPYPTWPLVDSLQRNGIQPAISNFSYPQMYL
jgi:hypothetical protein